MTTESSAAQDLDLAPMHANSLELGVVLVILPVLLGDRQERIGDELETIATLVDNGALEPHIDDRYAFEEVADATVARRRAISSGSCCWSLSSPCTYAGSSTYDGRCAYSIGSRTPMC